MADTKGGLFLNLVKKAVGLPTGKSSCCSPEVGPQSEASCCTTPAPAEQANSSACCSPKPASTGSCC
jgi:hypothetical protein